MSSKIKKALVTLLAAVLLAVMLSAQPMRASADGDPTPTPTQQQTNGPLPCGSGCQR